MIRRILFVTFACYLDDANGAAVASRAMMEALARRGFAVEVLCGPLLELGREVDLPSILAARGLSAQFRRANVSPFATFAASQECHARGSLETSGRLAGGVRRPASSAGKWGQAPGPIELRPESPGRHEAGSQSPFSSAARQAGENHSAPPAPDLLILDLNGVPVTMLAGPTLPRTPDEPECRAFLQLFEQIWAKYQPEVVVSYGGGWLTREILHRAKDRGAVTVLPLHNIRYGDPATFVDVDAVLVASRFAAEHYRNALGLRCTVLPNLVDHQRVRALERQPTYVVFVNPTVEKGVGVFARIADELGRRWPDIPFLVVEAKGTERDVAARGLELRAHGNVFFHEHTNDPRRFWRVAKVCLLPSLVAENQPLVAIEAMINGVPVLGSDRGGIPETLGKAGPVLGIPARLTPLSQSLPTPEEIAPWVEAIVEIWDSHAVYDQLSRRASIEAQRWAPEALEPRYKEFFATVGQTRSQ